MAQRVLTVALTAAGSILAHGQPFYRPLRCFLGPGVFGLVCCISGAPTVGDVECFIDKHESHPAAFKKKQLK